MRRPTPMYAVIIRAIHERGPAQARAVAELERRGNWLTPEMQRQASLCKVEKLQPGMRVDLESDAYADPEHPEDCPACEAGAGDHSSFEFEYEVVEEVVAETDKCTRVDFESGFSCGFPPWHLVAVAENGAYIPKRERNVVTPVIFRMDRPSEGGQCFALFPYEEERAGYVSCFQHVGQHSTADYTGCMDRSRPATPEEYAELKRELESVPYFYKLKVVKRRNRRELEKARAERDTA